MNNKAGITAKYAAAKVLIVVLTVCLCGCEVRSELPVYQQDSANNTMEVLPTEGNAAQEAVEQEVVYLQDEVLIGEIEDAQLHALTSYSQQFGKCLGIMELSEDEAASMRTIADALIAGFYNWNYTNHNEDNLNTGYELLSHDLRHKITESGCFESFIEDVMYYTLDTKIRYANILDHNVVYDYQSDEYGRVSCLRAEIVLHTTADQNGEFYEKYDHYVKGDTLLELSIFVKNVNGQLEVLGWEEFFCNPDRLTVYYPNYVGQVLVQPEQINTVSLVSLYEATNETHHFSEDELESIKEIIDIFVESNIVIQSSWQPYFAIFTSEQCTEIESRAPEIVQAVNEANPQVRIRDYACEACSTNEFPVYKRYTDGIDAYRVTLTYMLNNEGESVHQLMLYNGVYTYSTDIILVCEDGTFKIDYWKTQYTSEGALDIDFDAVTSDQG